MKPMLSTKELIEHMKEKGITFRETSEKEPPKNISQKIL